MTIESASVPAESTKISAMQTRFARNIRWQLVANASQAVLGGACLIVIGRLLGPTEFGVFSALMALMSVIGLLLEMRLQEVVARDFCNIGDTPVSSARALLLVDLFLLEVISRVLPALALVLFSDLLVRSINLGSDVASLVVFLAVGFVLSKSGSSVSSGLLRVLGRTDLIAGCVAADLGLRLTVTIIVALAWHLDVALALLIALVVSALCNGAQVWLACREYSIRIAPISWINWRIVGALTRLGSTRRLIVSNVVVSGSDLMAKDLDVVIISTVLSSDKVGLYKMAKSFVQVLWRAIDPFYITIMPEVQKLWQSGETTSLALLLRKTSVRLLLLSATLVMVGNIGMFLYGDMLLGANYSGVSGLMMLMSIWLVICAPLIWGIPLAIAVNRPELSVGGSVIGMLAGLTAFVMLTPAHGLAGAAVAWNVTLISGFVFTAGASLWIARSRLSTH
jgi:O-antigen/teichoic acid export membrane protein